MRNEILRETRPSPANDPGKDLLKPVGGAYTPMLISTFTGILIFILSGLFYDLLDIDKPAKWALLTGVTSMAAVWIFSLTRWFAYNKAIFLGTAERITRVDLDGDGYIGPPPAPATVKYVVQNTDHGAFRQKNYILPYPDIHKELADRALAGEAFSERNFAKGPRALFTPSQFAEFRKAALDRFLLQWRDVSQKRQGVVWSDDGLDLLRRIANKAPTHPQHDNTQSSAP